MEILLIVLVALWLSGGRRKKARRRYRRRGYWQGYSPYDYEQHEKCNGHLPWR